MDRHRPWAAPPAAIRAVVAASVLVMAAILGGCGEGRQTLTRDEAEIAAWYVEDVAHGNPRRAEELVLVGGSERMARIATWALGSEIDGQRTPPRQLAARAARWPAVRALLGAGMIVPAPDGGLLAPRPDLPRENRDIATRLVDDENRDRRTIDGVIIALADAEESTGRRYLATVGAARRQLDAQGR